MKLQEPDGPLEIAEHDELLTQDFHPDWKIAKLIGETNGLPETPEVFSTGRPGTCVRELRVFLGDIAVVVGAEAGGQEGRSGCHDTSPCYMESESLAR